MSGDKHKHHAVSFYHASHQYICGRIQNNRLVCFCWHYLPPGPTFLGRPRSPVSLTLGMDLNLECVAQNNDDAPNDLEFYWYQDGHRITPSSHITINSTSENATRVASSELVVMGVTDSDSGEYRCTATNRDIVDGITTTSSVTVQCK